MRKHPCLLALFAILCVPAGCRGDGEDQGTSAKDSSLTLLTDIDFTSEPYKRTFKVSEGSEELGCSGGTFLDHEVGQFQVEAILKVLTCTDGERSGSFIIRFHPSLVVTRWHVESATGDFTGLKGAGDFSVVENREKSGVETFTGAVSFR